jgi:hypothetical protein
MTMHKNQHYVPEFYLSMFSSDLASINVFNIENKDSYKKGIKHICSESYFYAKGDQLEECLSPLEQKFKDVIMKLSDGRDVSKLSKEDYIFILYFIGIQHGRTKKEKTYLEDLGDATIKMHLKEILSFEPKLAEDIGLTKEFLDELGDYKITTTGSSGQSIAQMYAMFLGLTSPFLTHDLEPILIINNTDIDFIISDHPIILYNAFFNNKRSTGITGFASHGLQIFCPIDPKIMLILYDKNFYEFDGNIINTIFETDITAVNSLQFFNCDKFIFFTDYHYIRYIKELYNKLEQLLRNDKSERTKWILCPSSFGVPTFSARLYRENINFNLELSFMKIKDGVRWDGFARNPQGVIELERIIASFERDSIKYNNKEGYYGIF